MDAQGYRKFTKWFMDSGSAAVPNPSPAAHVTRLTPYEQNQTVVILRRNFVHTTNKFVDNTIYFVRTMNNFVSAL